MTASQRLRANQEAAAVEGNTPRGSFLMGEVGAGAKREEREEGELQVRLFGLF